MKKQTMRIRKILIPLALTMAWLLSLPASAEDVFAEIAALPQVESTYISGRFSHNKKSWYNNSYSHAVDLSRGFSAMYTYECNSQEAVKKARTILESYLKKNPDVELMMKTKQGMEEYLIYEKFNKEGKVLQMIIWSQDAPNVCEIVVIDWDEGLERSRSPHSDMGSGGGFYGSASIYFSASDGAARGCASALRNFKQKQESFKSNTFE